MTLEEELALKQMLMQDQGQGLNMGEGVHSNITFGLPELLSSIGQQGYEIARSPLTASENLLSAIGSGDRWAPGMALLDYLANVPGPQEALLAKLGPLAMKGVNAIREIPLPAMISKKRNVVGNAIIPTESNIIPFPERSGTGDTIMAEENALKGRGDIITGTTPTPEGGIKKLSPGPDEPQWATYVPVKFIERDGPVKFDIESDGQAVVYGPRYMKDYLNTKLFRYIQEYHSPLKEKEFIRITQNKEDYEHLLKGTHRGSINRNVQDWEQPIAEGGLSVSREPEFGGNYAYYVTGDQIGHGADGEPLLDLATAKPASKLMTFKQLQSNFDKRLKKRLLELGISESDYKALVNARISDRWKDIPGPSSPPSGGKR